MGRFGGYFLCRENIMYLVFSVFVANILLSDHVPSWVVVKFTLCCRLGTEVPVIIIVASSANIISSALMFQ